MLAAPHLADLGRARGSVPAATRRQDLDALGSSYVDSGLLRDRDTTDGWAGAADGTLEERIYLLQNWRADVVALVEPDGDGGAVMREWIKYSAYGVPFGIPAGDANSDGVCDGADDALISAWLGQDPSPPYDVRLDVDLNGEIDAFDEEAIGDSHQSLGRGVLSGAFVGNRKGYAGYEGDARLAAKWHVRHRVLDSVGGRWLRRDPLGYVDGQSILAYVRSAPQSSVDSHGLFAATPISTSGLAAGEQAKTGGASTTSSYPGHGRFNRVEQQLWDLLSPLQKLWVTGAALKAELIGRTLATAGVSTESANFMRHCVLACEISKGTSGGWAIVFPSCSAPAFLDSEMTVIRRTP